MQGPESNRILKDARDLFDAGRMDEARDVLQEGLSTGPADPRVLHFLAYLHYRLGDLDKSRDTYRRLTGIDPENLTVWSNLGIVAFKMGHHEEARVAFEEYLGRKPDDPKILSYMAMVMKKMGRQAAAEKYQVKAAGGKIPRDEAARTVPEGAWGPQQAEGEEMPPAVAPGESSESAEEADMEGAVSLEEWGRCFDEEGILPEKRYCSLSQHVISVKLENRIHFTLPSLIMYHGIVVFERGPISYSRIPRKFRRDSLVLMSAEGNGKLWLTHDAGCLVTIHLGREAIGLNTHRLVAFESSLECESVLLGNSPFLPGMAALRLSGTGKVILAAGEGMASSGIVPGTPCYIRPASLVAWTDGLQIAVDSGEDFRKTMKSGDGNFLRIEGAGRIFIAGGPGG